MVNATGKPVHVVPPKVKAGVTVIVATTGALVLLMAVKAAILPEPEAARPIDGVLFVQLNTVPDTFPEKITGSVCCPLHTVWLSTGSTVGTGFTVISNSIGVPVQVSPLAVKVAVTENVLVNGVIPALAAVNAGTKFQNCNLPTDSPVIWESK